MKLLVFMTILPVAFTIRSIASATWGWSDYRKGNVPAVPAGSLLPRSKNYAKTYCFHLENLATTKMFGMDHYFPTTLKNSFLYIYELGNARMFSTAWDSLYKDLGDKQLKLILRNRNA